MSARPLAELVTPGRHLALVGTTASGKSDVALAVARRRADVELVSVDSMQVYRGMDIGTAKPTPVEQAEVRHHLLDLVEPSADYDVATFATDVRAALVDIEARGRRALLVGGTGLYLRAAVDDLDVPSQHPEVRAELDADPDTIGLHRRLAELDPTAAARMEPTNRRRVLRALEVTVGSGRPFSSYGPGLDAYPASPIGLVGIRRSRPDVDARIVARYEAQLAAGFLDEVVALAARPGGLSRTAGQALGYKELLEHLGGRCSSAEAIELAVVRTRQFARRQERWFRRDPRIAWFDVPDPAAGPFATSDHSPSAGDVSGGEASATADPLDAEGATAGGAGPVGLGPAPADLPGSIGATGADLDAVVDELLRRFAAGDG